MRWPGHVVIRDRREMYVDFLWEPERKRTLNELDVERRVILKRISK
jgi:hypothetical protein